MTHDETYSTDKFDDLLILVTGGTNYTMAEEHLLYRKVLSAILELHKPHDAADATFCLQCLCKYPCKNIMTIEEHMK